MEIRLKIKSKSELFAVKYAIEEYYHNVTRKVDVEKLSPFALEVHNSVKDLHNYFRTMAVKTK